jgi:dTDP-4-dehydrorhamnose 3,5-epimerase
LKITETFIKGCFIIQPKIYEDNRGLFFESFKKKDLEIALGKSIDFVQDNQSISKKWTLRGLHFQKGTSAQSKLVNVPYGEVLDVVVDVRTESPTYGKYFKIKLSSINHTSLYIPRGLAHGFLSLQENTVFQYKCDNYYHQESEGGILYNDLELGIDWDYNNENLIISEKDRELPSFNTL